jgi:hypothetical protein
MVRGVTFAAGDALADTGTIDTLAGRDDVTDAGVAGKEGVLHPGIPVGAWIEVATEDDALGTG